MPGKVGDSFPVASDHGLVGHHFEQGAGLVEVINRLAQFLVRLPVLEGFRQLAASVGGLR